MRVLVACEYSGRVREAFRKMGHDVISCDLLPSEDSSPYHYQGDVFALIADQQFDLMVAHPPCTYLCSSGLHWNKRRPERAEMTEAALEFVRQLMAAPIPKKAIENPIGCISTRIRSPDQIIQPWQFGEDASKATCLWLAGLPKLVATKIIAPRAVGRKLLYGNQTDSGQNNLTPSPDRWKDRSRTYQGIADAMAAQWVAHDAG